MNFPGYWIDTSGLALRMTPDVSDEANRTEASNWTEAHQNDDRSEPHGRLINFWPLESSI